MKKLYVIGGGPGSGDLLTRQAETALALSDRVWVSGRGEERVPQARRRPILPLDRAMDEMEAAMQEGLQCAVLLSGDPGLYGMLPLLEARLGKDALCVLSGVSSVQEMCARLALPWQDARILSAHGRPLAESALCHYARTCAKVLVLLDNRHTPQWVHRALCLGGLGHLSLVIGERLSYPEERIGAYEDRPYDPLSIALIRNQDPCHLPETGIRDEAFERGRVPMTKREIRQLVLSELHLPMDAVVWDIGAGTGSVSVEASLQCPLGRVYAVERDGEALALLERNREKFHALNLTLVPGSAPEALLALPRPTHVFVGGTGGKLDAIAQRLAALAPVRVVATAVTLETAQAWMRILGTCRDFAASQVSVSRLEAAGPCHMLKAHNPVFVFSATLEEQA